MAIAFFSDRPAAPYIGSAEKARLIAPRKQVMPSGNQIMLQCRCGNTNSFTVMLEPDVGSGTVRTSTLVCNQCAKHVNCDDFGRITTDGRKLNLTPSEVTTGG